MLISHFLAKHEFQISMTDLLCIAMGKPIKAASVSSTKLPVKTLDQCNQIWEQASPPLRERRSVFAAVY